MTREALHQRLDGLNVWKRGDERAAHKPLLLLLAMGRAVRGEERLVSFREIEAPLTDLLWHFGPPRRAYHPELPFRHLATDGLWEVPEVSSWGKKHLRDRGIKGGLPEPLYRMLAAGARLAAHRLLDLLLPATYRRYGEQRRQGADFIVIDEVQKVPALLDVVHWLIERRGVHFALCGSSARKVRRGQANPLGGRGERRELHGLSAMEIGSGVDLVRLLNHGYLPPLYDAERPLPLLDAYVSQYLKGGDRGRGARAAIARLR